MIEKEIKMSDENNNNVQNEINKENVLEQKHEEHNTQVLKFIAIIVAIFLGTFAAVYTIVDMTMYKLGFQPFVTLTKEFEKMFDDEIDFLEKSSPAPIKIEDKDDKYVVTINLKNFDNNPDNIDISVENNGIKMSGSLKHNTQNEVKENSFYQNIIFPNKIDETNIKKEVKKKNIVITIPFQKEQNF